MEKRSRSAQLSREILREVNDKMYEALVNYQTYSRSGGFICECGRESCEKKVEMKLDDYVQVRKEHGPASLIESTHVRQDDRILDTLLDFVFVTFPADAPHDDDNGNSSVQASR